MSAIPLLIMEEHHEAFFIWNYAVLNGWIPPNKNLLLHVDEHSDFGTPNLSNSLNSLKGDLENIYNFTYTELGIADFIIPSIYQGIFNELYWLRQTHNAEQTEVMNHVFSLNAEGKILFVTEDVNKAGLFNLDRKPLKNKLITTTDSLVNQEKTVVVDIDLDYFSCDNQAGEVWEIEVSKETYESFLNNPYDPIRIKLGGTAKMKEKNGKSYFYMQRPIMESVLEKDRALKVSQAEILERIEKFSTFLIENKIQPKLIDICRSRLSGYTPGDQWQFIESNLIKKLQDIYPVEVKSIQDILSVKT
ncbi:MAG: hypothetical protein GPJ27_03870 [Microcystis aeruginosa L111-01]|jgi:hypothetical protein|uniref:Uncharacterized protein n=1 Tax=Microcystis aeruginosa Ma_QC_B_20070730_S2 TaxID=2486256 RepID=A0A552D7M6_MICAE|nr:hypothetical protein [Microcystis aeruginosa L111-01]TRU18204.1 MAG: hypothetical protein EWV80_21025 [Microcystis aeruginosa Ma_QC_B_20070730_S2]